MAIGRIGKPHGVRGWVTVAATTDEPERRFADLYRPAGNERDGAVDDIPVISRPVCRTEIVKPIDIAFPSDLGVKPRGEGVRDTDIASRRSAHGRAKLCKLNGLFGPARGIDVEKCHF